MQAVLVGLTNLVFTLFAMVLIDRIGRKPLLVFGVAGIALCMMLLAWGFNSATYLLSGDAIAALPDSLDRSALLAVQDITYVSDVSFRQAMIESLGASVFQEFESPLISAAIVIQPMLILAGILGLSCFQTEYAVWRSRSWVWSTLASASWCSCCFPGNSPIWVTRARSSSMAYSPLWGCC
jgi:MFS family permease